MPIISTPDHVAVAVPSIDEAAARWHDELGGVWCSPPHSSGTGFATQQLWFRGGAKLELLEPATDDGFAAGFLHRFGARVHHITLKVPDLFAAIETIRAAGYDVVDIDTSNDEWHEGFLRPSQVGGVIVQIARSSLDDADWMRMLDFEPEPQPTAGPRLHGPTFFHPDLDAAERLWTVLGAEVQRIIEPSIPPDGQAVERRGSQPDDARATESVWVTWPDAALDLRIEQRPEPDTPVLRFSDAPCLAADDRLGPTTVPKHA